MKSSLTGLGTLRLPNGGEICGAVQTDAYASDERQKHEVRIVMSNRQPGGFVLDMNLSPEDAAYLASTIYSLAKVAMIRSDHETAIVAENQQAAAA